ncbi:restriction endonuclease subunit S [Candidatus Peribacteria bacterium]|nr:restriction endonuclease subunit S [Candidatus Peribacteria bacterium]
MNRNEVYEIQIPLPPLLRQHEIVEHLDRVFAHTAELRSSYEAQIRDLETLRQSLLEEAFAGRLVSE